MSDTPETTAPSRDDEWLTDVFEADEWLAIAEDIRQVKIDRYMRKRVPQVSRKPVWPPVSDITVLVENRGTKPVVHVFGRDVYGVHVAKCGVSPASTMWQVRQLAVDGFVGCKHCWDRQ